MNRFYFDPHNYNSEDNIFCNDEVFVGDIIILPDDTRFVVTEKNIEMSYNSVPKANFHLESLEPRMEYDPFASRINSPITSINIETGLKKNKELSKKERNKFKELSEKERNKFMELLE